MVTYEGVRAKSSRAGDGLASLETDISAVCKNMRRAIVHEIREDVNKQVWIYRGETPEAPIEWSVRIGEILYNLRSALDHLVWQLVLANGEKPGRHNEFPIVNDASEWGQARGRKLKGISQAAAARIERLQPYTGGIGFPFNVFAFRTLRTLCNIDKHRHLMLAVIGSYGINPIIFGHNHPPLDRPGSSPPLQGYGPKGKIERGTILLCLNDAESEISPDFQIEVRFEDEDIEQPETVGTVPSILRECLEAVQGSVRWVREGGGWPP